LANVDKMVFFFYLLKEKCLKWPNVIYSFGNKLLRDDQYRQCQS